MADYTDIILASISARENSYCPYSDFAVGAALKAKSGKIYTGCNVESAAFTPTCCAERLAFFKAVEAGETEFEAIAVMGGKKGEEIKTLCMPCGVCREVMREFCKEDFKVISVIDGQKFRVFEFEEILPNSFAGL